MISESDFLESIQCNLALINCRPNHFREINLHQYAEQTYSRIVQGRVIRKPCYELTVMTTRRGIIQFIVRKGYIADFLENMTNHVSQYTKCLDIFDTRSQPVEYETKLVNIQCSLKIKHFALMLLLRTDPANLRSHAKNHGLGIELVNPEVCAAWNIRCQGCCLRINRKTHTLTARNFDEAYDLLTKTKIFLDTLLNKESI